MTYPGVTELLIRKSEVRICVQAPEIGPRVIPMLNQPAALLRVLRILLSAGLTTTCSVLYVSGPSSKVTLSKPMRYRGESQNDFWFSQSNKLFGDPESLGKLIIITIITSVTNERPGKFLS